MAKERRAPRSSRVSPYPRRSIRLQKLEPEKPETNSKEWEEARCPVCMEHPHNAVLIKCSNHNRGCRPYICDTSDLQSNCLHRFHKSSGHRRLSCPLCRGRAIKRVVNKPAREFMNSRARACSLDGCDFMGTFDELAAHAVVGHPLARPADVDLARQLDWARMEEEWEIEDLESFQYDGFDQDEIEDLDSFQHDGFGESDQDPYEMMSPRSDLRPRRVPERPQEPRTRNVIETSTDQDVEGINLETLTVGTFSWSLNWTRMENGGYECEAEFEIEA